MASLHDGESAQGRRVRSAHGLLHNGRNLHRGPELAARAGGQSHTRPIVQEDVRVRSTAQIAGHPIHPMLVPIPIACFVGALLTDIAYVVSAEIMWADFRLGFCSSASSSACWRPSRA